MRALGFIFKVSRYCIFPMGIIYLIYYLVSFFYALVQRFHFVLLVLCISTLENLRKIN